MRLSDSFQLPSVDILSVLRCPFNTEHNELDLLEIKQYTSKSTNQETYLPIPGTFVPVSRHHLLRRDVLLMKAGDYAALEKYDPAENGEPGEPTYILVQVIKQINDDTAGAPFDAKYEVNIGRGQSADVSAALLYAFVRQATGAAPCDDGSEDAGFEKNHAVDYDDVVDDLKITLTDAWKMEPQDRNKILKRLILQWHPESNSDNSDLATKVTQFILFAADRLDRGLPLNDGNVGAMSSSQLTSTPVSSTAYSSSGSGSSLCHSYYQYMSQRAREHQQQQRDYERNYALNTSRVVERRKEHFFQSFLSGMNPQPGEGRRWLRQAEMDVQAATNDQHAESKAYEWACYKYYQVG